MNWLKKIFSAKSLDGLSPAALRDLNDRSWRWGNSKWLWLVWALAGGYGIVLIVQGSRFRSSRLVIVGALSFVLIILGLSIAPPANEDGTPVENVSFIIPIMLSFILSISAAHYFNRDVLVEKARRLHSPQDDWLKTNFGVSAPVGESITPRMDRGTEQLLAANGLKPESPVKLQTGSQDQDPSSRLDINAASLQQIVNLGIFSDDQVIAIVKQRDSRPFQSLDEVRVFLDLKPHELAEVKKVIEVQSSSSQVSKNPPGRIVDL